VIVDFGKNITVNGKSLYNQVPSVNGYVVEIVKNNGQNELLVSIANERGEKDSDEL